MKAWGEDQYVLDPAKLFLSEKVVQTIETNKVFLSSYNLHKVLASIPFANSTYVTVCPVCVKKAGFADFKKLVASGLVIPVLLGRYKSYPDELVEFLLRTDHVSGHEYGAYRFARISENVSRGLCAHCASKRVDEIIASIKRRKGAKEYRERVRQLGRNIFPFAYPDYTLLDEARAACGELDMKKLEQLDRLGWSIYSIRSAQALNAPITVDEQSISEIPSGITTESDAALRSLSDLKEFASRGLGLKFPSDIPLDQYVELAKDFRPAIAEAMNYAGVTNGVSPDDLSKKISNLNSEIERIRGLKRYVMLEASVTLVRQNKDLLFTSILAGTLGLTTGLLGCAGGMVAGASLRIAKRKGLKFSENEAATRLGRMVARDVQPYLSKLIAAYVGSNPAAINVLSLRKKFEEAKAA
jgi:hypothetical protein